MHEEMYSITSGQGYTEQDHVKYRTNIWVVKMEKADTTKYWREYRAIGLH